MLGQHQADEDYPMVAAEEFERDSETWMAEAVRCGAIRVVEPNGDDVYVFAAWRHQEIVAAAAAARQWQAAMQRVFGKDT